ncbi:MAG: hypothetical protein IJP97_02330 [Synergistaceae bacterium]|nr:hypothetical protein [Synergistaceae bacterium]MBR0069314.1 hypothetical protein [Synergistaceae bacterium]
MSQRTLRSIGVISLIFALLFSFSAVASADVAIDEAHFPDPVFRSMVGVYDQFPRDGILSDEEIASIEFLNSQKLEEKNYEGDVMTC